MGGSREPYLFVGIGGDAKFGGLGNKGISASYTASFGYAFEGDIGRWSGGVGFYGNFDTLTSCAAHGGR